MTSPSSITYNGFEFLPVYNSDFATVCYNENLNVILCQADYEYIPFNEFKSIFFCIGGLLKVYPATSLIFDKRKLKTFHQPSMEWYFTEWKIFAKERGLTHHYKILPSHEWFAKAVEAGKNEIFSKHGTSFLEGIKVEYFQSVEDILHEIAAKRAAS